jgi:hypothetical protein
MGSKKVETSAVEASLTALSRKLEGSALLKQGSILFRFTDSGEECCVESRGREARVTRAASVMSPLVQVSGPAAVLKAIMDGRREVRSAFAAGGIQAQGDLMFLEALLKELGLLQCE